MGGHKNRPILHQNGMENRNGALKKTIKTEFLRCVCSRKSQSWHFRLCVSVASLLPYNVNKPIRYHQALCGQDPHAHKNDMS